ncbi:MAG: sensor histidine kinase [Nanobdellota archaeon]
MTSGELILEGGKFLMGNVTLNPMIYLFVILALLVYAYLFMSMGKNMDKTSWLFRLTILSSFIIMILDVSGLFDSKVIWIWFFFFIFQVLMSLKKPARWVNYLYILNIVVSFFSYDILVYGLVAVYSLLPLLFFREKSRTLVFILHFNLFMALFIFGNKVFFPFLSLDALYMIYPLFITFFISKALLEKRIIKENMNRMLAFVVLAILLIISLFFVNLIRTSDSVSREMVVNEVEGARKVSEMMAEGCEGSCYYRDYNVTAESSDRRISEKAYLHDMDGYGNKKLEYHDIISDKHITVTKTFSFSDTLRRLWMFSSVIILLIIVLGYVGTRLLFRSFRKRVRERTKDLEQLNRELELNVEERTKVLNDKSREYEELNRNLEKQVQKKTEELENKLKKEEKTSKAMVFLLKKQKEARKKIQDQTKELSEKNKELRKAQKSLEDEKQSVEEKVKKRTSEVKKLLKLKTDFINQLSHDLRTPLTPLNIFLPIVRNKVKDEQLKKNLDVCIKNTKYLKELVVRTLDLSRLDAGKVEFKFQDTDMKGFIEAIVEDFQDSFKKKGITIINKVSGSYPVRIDTVRMKEVINNLMTNAAKYMGGEGSITINAYEKGGHYVFSFADTGKGMNKRTAEKMFDEFYKADSSRHDLGSYGLGLAISKKLVEGHKGKIWARSDGPGKGSTFYFSIPKRLNNKTTKNKINE